MDPHAFSEETGTNEREPIGPAGGVYSRFVKNDTGTTSLDTRDLMPPAHVNVPDCSVCELPHPIGTPHPERIHPGARTVLVRIKIAVGSDGTTFVEPYGEGFDGMRIVFIEANVPLPEVEIIQAKVVQ